MDKKTDDNIDHEFFNQFVSNRIKNTSANLAEENPKERVKTIHTLFKMMIGTYGKYFADQFDNSVAREVWLNGLLIYKKEHISSGFELMLQDPSFNSTPNLKKFLSYCEDAKRGRNYIAEAKKRIEDKRLPKLKDVKNQ